MAVYIIEHIAPNGNRMSRPIVASCAADALNEREAELGIEDAQAEGFTVNVRVAADPDGTYERALSAAETRYRR